MTVTLMGAPASVWAALRPPKPAPTITTRWTYGCAALPFMVLLYKIQRDGHGLKKFSCGLESGVGAMAHPVGRRPAFRGAVGFAHPYQSIGAAAGRCRS